VTGPTPSTAGFGLQAKKAFGQNFLVQRSAVELILREGLGAASEALLEVGPGPGTLTEGLLAEGRPLWAVDLDPEACDLLRQRYGAQPHFHLLQGDAVRVPLPDAASWSVIGNLPYNAATAILGRFLLEPIPWTRMVLMFQLEVGQKILGRPGEKAYGPLSVLAQVASRPQRLLKLGPGAFRPSPKVDSVVLRFDPRPDAPDLDHRARLLRLLHLGFAHRRKTLANNLTPRLGPAVPDLLGAEGLPPMVRGEALAPSQWLSLLARLESAGLRMSHAEDDPSPGI
jgi:16S rRNA (adenine1518-N6/adenine1519-N6)-dimethyltransferase